jgi:hypothetical protein
MYRAADCLWVIVGALFCAQAPPRPHHALIPTPLSYLAYVVPQCNACYCAVVAALYVQELAGGSTQ